MRVVEQLVRLASGEWLRKEPKTPASVRSITISRVSADVLSEHLARFAGAGVDGLVFPNHNYPAHPKRWGPLTLTSLPEDFSNIKGDLVLHSWFDGGKLSCALAFYTEILTRAKVQELVAEFKSIVAELVREGTA